MKYIKLFEDHSKKSAMNKLLDSGTDIEVVKDYKSKQSKEQKEIIKKKQEEYFDKVEKCTKENDDNDKDE